MATNNHSAAAPGAAGPVTAVVEPTRIHGALAMFDSSAELFHAAEKVRDAGYKNWDAHSPFPIHGMDEAMGQKRSRLPWFVAVCAIIGFASFLGIQWWSAADAYPIVVSGKPFFSHVAFFPITFAGTVLLSVLGTVIGLTIFIRQRFTHPVFFSDTFDRASNDGFFISVLADDAQFDRDKTLAFLREIGATHVELLEEK